MNRSGVALLAVLWVITALTVVMSSGAIAMRMGGRVSQNRIVLARARWAAEACLAIVQARWVAGRSTGAETISLGRETKCTWWIDDPHERINVNTVASRELVRLLQVLGIRDSNGAMFANEVIESRRIALFTDVSTLRPLPGFDPRAIPFLTVHGTGRVNAAIAPRAVLMALPGVTPEAVDALLARRKSAHPIASLDELLGALSPAAREPLLASYTELSRLVTFTSTQQLLTATGWVGATPRAPFSQIQLLVAVTPERLAVVWRRLR